MLVMVMGIMHLMGQMGVMVEIPAFYVKGEQTTSQVYQWWISGVPI